MGWQGCYFGGLCEQLDWSHCIARRSVSDGGGSDSGPGALSQDCPDMTGGDQASVVLVAGVVFDAVAKADFNHADVLLGFCLALFLVFLHVYL